MRNFMLNLFKMCFVLFFYLFSFLSSKAAGWSSRQVAEEDRQISVSRQMGEVSSKGKLSYFICNACVIKCHRTILFFELGLFYLVAFGTKIKTKLIYKNSINLSWISGFFFFFFTCICLFFRHLGAAERATLTYCHLQGWNGKCVHNHLFTHSPDTEQYKH